MSNVTGRGETDLTPTTPRAPPAARSLVSRVRNHQHDITERGVTA